MIMDKGKQLDLLIEWLYICMANGQTDEYPEHDLIELIAAVNDDVPSLCLDQYLS